MRKVFREGDHQPVHLPSHTPRGTTGGPYLPFHRGPHLPFLSFFPPFFPEMSLSSLLETFFDRYCSIRRSRTAATLASAWPGGQTNRPKKAPVVKIDE